MIRDAIGTLMKGIDLTPEEAGASMQEIMDGKATQAQIGAFLAGLRMKGETTGEITGCARILRAKAERVDLGRETVDIVGTGGDGSNSFNISTTCAFVVSAAGMPVAKHGNRAVSSRSGAADVLEALGVAIALSPEQAKACFDRTGMCFLFAPGYHRSMKHAAGPRREMGTRTVFNLLGPLANPAFASRILLGVHSEELVEPMARVLANLGVRAALTVHGQDGLDEISVSAPTTVCEIRGGHMAGYILHPAQFGIPSAPLSAIVGGDAAENAAILRGILAGEIGPRRDIVLLNSGAALYISGKAPTLREGLRLAAAAIDSGAAAAQLEAYRRASNEEAARPPAEGASA